MWVSGTAKGRGAVNKQTSNSDGQIRNVPYRAGINPAAGFRD